MTSAALQLADYEGEIIEESVIELNNIITALIYLESCDGHLNDELYNSIFRGLHSVKGALGMSSRREETEFAHKIEELFQRYQDKKQIDLGDLDLLINACESLENKLKNPEGILFNFNHCQTCIKKPQDKNCNQSCHQRSDFKLYNTDNIEEAVIIFIMDKIENKLTNCLNTHQIPYIHVYCAEKIYKLGSGIKNFKVVVLNDINKDIPFYHFINLFNKHNEMAQYYVVKSGNEYHLDVREVNKVRFKYFNDCSNILMETLETDILKKN